MKEGSAIAAVAAPPARSSRASARRRSRYLGGLLSASGVTGCALVVIVVLAGLVLPALVQYGPLQQGADTLAPPGTGHLLGTDEVGRDIFARVLAGIRIDSLLVLVAVPIAAVAGTALGMLSTTRALVGDVIQGIFGVLLGFPGVVMGVAISIALAPGERSVVLAIILVTTPMFGRQARVTTQAQLTREYVLAGTALGTSPAKILWVHVLPNVIDSVIVRAVVAASQAIQIEGALSVVGLGIQPPQASLGGLISDGSQYLSSSPLYSLAPIIVIFILCLGLTLIADALNEAVLGQ
jgi:peptide/nickel transport system permease protein